MNTLPTLQLPSDDTISYKIYVAKAVPLTDVSVTAHLDEFNRASGRQWRLGDVTLGVPGGGRSSGRLTKGGYVEDADEPLGKFMESGLSGVEKVSLTAEVTLRSARPTLESPCL